MIGDIENRRSATSTKDLAGNRYRRSEKFVKDSC